MSVGKCLCRPERARVIMQASGVIAPCRPCAQALALAAGGDMLLAGMARLFGIVRGSPSEHMPPNIARFSAMFMKRIDRASILLCNVIENIRHF